MPLARESLLDAAWTALARRPWSAVRMVDVASVAGVSRQTLYNEFGSKDGLARALVRREVDSYLLGAERALTGHPDPRERLAAVAEWTVTAARSNPLIRAALTGLWSERLPAPALTAVPSSVAVPAQRRADGPLPSPAELLALVRDQAVGTLTAPGAPRSDAVDIARGAELALRLALSSILAPVGAGGVAHLVRETLAALPSLMAIPGA
ncbi:TetR/AcrR family transcriptional regulator [Streptomyces sp. NPDC058001]|uniref:TetR/AcrR family transcriptional regulator n=1 Tax=Streptomyces sp. NPDC058001 TaxID=3346300 RepID=UPI0036ED8DC1